jgi:hypothetical protein
MLVNSTQVCDLAGMGSQVSFRKISINSSPEKIEPAYYLFFYYVQWVRRVFDIKGTRIENLPPEFVDGALDIARISDPHHKWLCCFDSPRDDD